MKSGTTSLYKYLSAHPEIYMAKGTNNKKTLHYFCEDINWHKGREWYEAQFTEAEKRTFRYFGKRKYKAVGEASGTYTKYPRFKDVPEKIHALVPDVKLIYILRDPIKRILSHIDHQIIEGLRPPVGQLTIDTFQPIHIITSKYFTQINQYLPYFDKRQILIICTEELQENKRAVLRETFRFLGVNENYWSPNFEKQYHSSSIKRARLTANIEADNNNESTGGTISLPRDVAALPSDVRDYLMSELKPEVDALRKFTGKSLSQWSL